MSQPALALETEGLDVAACGYDAVRAAFRRVLELCVKPLACADLQRVADPLDCDIDPGLSDEVFDMAMDTALHSRSGGPPRRRRAKRAIDRIAGKLPFPKGKTLPIFSCLAP